MKKNLSIIALFLAILGCKQQPTIEKNGGIIVTASFLSYNNMVKQDLKIIKERILDEGFVLQNIIIDSLKNKVTLTIPEAKDSGHITDLLTKKGIISIFNSYENSEIINGLVKANENIRQIKRDSLKKYAKAQENKELSLKELVKQDTSDIFSTKARNNPLFSILVPAISGNSQPLPGAFLGYAKSSDTAMVIYYLNLPINKSLFPKNLVLLWSLKSLANSKDKLFELFAIKSIPQDFQDIGKNVKTCKYKTGVNKSSYEIFFRLDEIGTRIFACITRENIGRCLPITLDNKVLVSPRVNSAIERGECVISGNFNLEEAKSISSILKCGALSGILKVTHLQIVNNNKEYGSRKIN